MFELKYRIVDDIKKLSLITPEVFDKDFGNFEGQIELNFNGNKIGYVYEGEISEEMFKVGCFQNEWVLSWLTNLLQAVKLLRENNYLILAEIECPNFIEFTKSNDSIKVQEYRLLPLNISNFQSAGVPAMSVLPLSQEIVLKTGEKYSQDAQLKPTSFVESFISYMEFEQEVKKKCILFLSEIKKRLPNLINSRAIKDYEKALITLSN